jgi:hypothetical protein
MDRRNLLAGLAALALSLFVLGGTATAHVAHHKRAKPRDTGSTATPETCVVNALPGQFMDQGEFGNSSSIADIIEVECEAVYAEQYVQISANELYSRCQHALYWRQPNWEGEGHGAGYRVRLDNDGNATVIVLGGPSCAAGESLISAHLESPPYTTATTGFTVLPPRPSPVGVSALPATKVEGEEASDVATIVQVEFPPVFAEEPVNVNASQLLARCKNAPRIEWLFMSQYGYVHELAGSEDFTLHLDNDGNAFVVLVGSSSCAAGSSLIEASLENAPYTTYTTEFTIEPPQPTFPVAPAD